jgi:hypothetical protein
MKFIFLLLAFAFSLFPADAQQASPANAPPAQSGPPQDKLPDVPQPQQPSLQNKSAQEDAKISPSGKLPAILAPQITREPLDAGDKFHLYLHQAFNPVALLPPAFGAGLRMASPRDHYPRDWKDGAGAFGRLYGDSMARRESQLAAEALAEITFREDPRYLPSSSHHVFPRVVHALAFVIVDRSDSAHNTLAYSHFFGAAASGAVGAFYLPGGYNDATHAGQRAAATFQSFAISNVANEFCPEWGPLMLKLHLPFVHPPCAERIKRKPAPAPDQK